MDLSISLFVCFWLFVLFFLMYSEMRNFKRIVIDFFLLWLEISTKFNTIRFGLVDEIFLFVLCIGNDWLGGVLVFLFFCNVFFPFRVFFGCLLRSQTTFIVGIVVVVNLIVHCLRISHSIMETIRIKSIIVSILPLD